MKLRNRIIIAACGLLAAGTVTDGLFGTTIVTRETAAIVGRPLTPGSVAGVARRTSRRVIRRSTIYAPFCRRGVLPS